MMPNDNDDDGFMIIIETVLPNSFVDTISQSRSQAIYYLLAISSQP